MTTNTDEKDEKTGEFHKEHYPLFRISRKILLASIGAFAIAQDEIEDFIDKLVDRGEIAEKDGKKLFQEVMERRKEHFQGREDEMRKRIESVLDHLNIPTKSEIETLTKKVTVLSKKIDELKKVQGGLEKE